MNHSVLRKISVYLITAAILLCCAVIFSSCGDKSEPVQTGFYYGTPEPSPTPEPPAENTVKPYSEEAGKKYIKASQTKAYSDNKHGIKKFLLDTGKNPFLPFNVQCFISEDTISAVVPSGLELSKTVVDVETNKSVSSMKFNGEEFISGETAVDLSSKGVFTVIQENGTEIEISVNIETLNTGLPSVALTIENYGQINSKTDRVPCSLYAGGGYIGTCPYAADEPITVTGSAKGRGNSSWYWDWPKKSYTIKLDGKEDLLGMGKSKDYVLVTCVRDRSLMRNNLMTFLGNALDMEYVMDSRIVDFWLNGKYWGVYTLIEKIEISKASVDIPDWDSSDDPSKIGYLLEWDGHAQEVPDWQRNNWKNINGVKYDSVTGNYLINFSKYKGLKDRWLTINYPNQNHLTTDECKYVYDYMSHVIEALSNGDWAEADKYMDMESFVKWYIVEDLTVNTDAVFWTSCWMYIDGSGELSMGPLWDFDKSIGNNGYTSDKKYMEKTQIYKWLTAMPEYNKLAYEIWSKYYGELCGIADYIDSVAEMVSKSQICDMELDDSLWNGAHEYREKDFTFTTYEDELSSMKKFLSERMTYLNNLLYYASQSQ